MNISNGIQNHNITSITVPMGVQVDKTSFSAPATSAG